MQKFSAVHLDIDEAIGQFANAKDEASNDSIDYTETIRAALSLSYLHAGCGNADCTYLQYSGWPQRLMKSSPAA